MRSAAVMKHKDRRSSTTTHSVERRNMSAELVVLPMVAMQMSPCPVSIRLPSVILFRIVSLGVFFGYHPYHEWMGFLKRLLFVIFPNPPSPVRILTTSHTPLGSTFLHILIVIGDTKDATYAERCRKREHVRGARGGALSQPV